MHPVTLGKGLTIAGMAVIMGAFVLGSSFYQMPLPLLMFFGVVIGGPMIGCGLHLESKIQTPAAARTSFWPSAKDTRKAGWNVLLYIAFILPIIMLPPLLFLPKGDDWFMATLRLSLVIVIGSIWYLWLQTSPFWSEKYFRGRASDGVVDHFQKREPKPKNLYTALKANWPVLGIAVAAFAVVFGVIDFQNPALNLDAGSKRFRTLGRILLWCRGNPNTVWSSSLIIGIGASVVFSYQILRVTYAKPRPVDWNNGQPS